MADSGRNNLINAASNLPDVITEAVKRGYFVSFSLHPAVNEMLIGIAHNKTDQFFETTRNVSMRVLATAPDNAFDPIAKELYMMLVKIGAFE
jgi:hypothetical protein